MPDESPSPGAGAVERVFHAALELQPAERPAYLDGACGSDRRLRRRVEALLLAHEATQEFLPEQPVGIHPSLAQATALLEVGSPSDPSHGTRRGGHESFGLLERP